MQEAENDTDFRPDDIRYVPRIFFIDREGKIQYEIKNENGDTEETRTKYPYYYASPEECNL